MQVIDLKINHVTNPLGYDLSLVSATYLVECDASHAQWQKSARIEVASDQHFEHLLLDTGWDETISSLGHELSFTVLPCTRYFWRVSVEADNGDVATSDTAWFETAKLDQEWQAKWIAAHDSEIAAPLFNKQFVIDKKPIASARAYVSGVGLYEFYANGQKVGDEYLAPGCTAYDSRIQYHTYDLTHMLNKHENALSVYLGNGWYKGRFGFNHGGKENHYGVLNEFICELVILYEDGSRTVIGTDDSWHSSLSSIGRNSIYDGEHIDANTVLNFQPAVVTEQTLHARLQARTGLPIVVHERLSPTITELDSGECILDFGANIVGWIEFDSELEQGESVSLHYAEVLQNGDIYTENLRTAESIFSYTSNGQYEHVRPHFTFYGFRYAKVVGNVKGLKNIQACFVYSDIKQLSALSTGVPAVNQFIDNVIRSHKDNFFDIPTDCPQRDERMGWTGDLQVFSSPACMNMDVYAFLTKYLTDLSIEQDKMEGAVPFVVPMFDVKEAGSCAWGDAATVVPWNMWLHYGDKAILKQQYTSMKNWVEYIVTQVNKQTSSKLLWDSGFHFGDWLALDNEPHIKTFKGKTEDKFVASIYFHFSAALVGKTAKVLGFETDAAHYSNLANEILAELRKEYLTLNGKLALETQTAYILAILFDVYPPEFHSRAAQDLKAKLARDQFKITSGFVGTPYFCRALTKVGLKDIAYRMFLSEEKPSWLYAVKQGATTIWERWDSIGEDGVMNPDTSMNSLNHYAFGSVIDWLYKDVCGLMPVESNPGFKSAFIAPKPDYRLGHVELVTDTAAGKYHVAWNINETGYLTLELGIPFDTKASLVLPDIDDFSKVSHGGLKPQAFKVQGNDLLLELAPGEYRFSYQPTVEYIPRYNVEMPLRELIKNGQTKSILESYIPDVMALPFLGMLENESLVALSHKPFFNYDKAVIDTIGEAIACHVVC